MDMPCDLGHRASLFYSLRVNDLSASNANQAGGPGKVDVGELFVRAGREVNGKPVLAGADGDGAGRTGAIRGQSPRKCCRNCGSGETCATGEGFALDTLFEGADVKTILSASDRALFPHEHRDEILIVPNGVDHDYFKPQEREKRYDLVFTGNMSYPPTVNAVDYLANEILPIVWKTLPDVKLYIAGATPDPKVKKAASDRIIVSGWLDDIRNAYAQSRVFIAPMRIGTGLQNKLLEAMSMSLPAITSPLANASLGAKPNEEILIGNNAKEMANNIIALLTDTQKAEQIAQAGFDFTNRVYDWGKATEVLEEAMKKQIIK